MRRVPLVVPTGTPVRVALVKAGLHPEGCAVLDGATPWPLDRSLDTDAILTVVATFSGG